jgi:predicted RNase H-like HicB family nuclease
MTAMAHSAYREDAFFVAQCRNADVSSFGTTREEAIANLKPLIFTSKVSQPTLTRP